MLVKADMKSGVTMTLIILVSALLTTPAFPAEWQHPDFSGIWTWYIEPGQNPFSRELPDLPLQPQARQKVDEYRALVAENGDNPSGWCLGTGMPGSMLGSGGYPMEIIQRPEQITVIYEAHQEIRRIYIGHNVFPEKDMIPDRNGYSEGHWEGDKLVVTTTHLKEQIDQVYVHSSHTKVVESYHLTKTDDGKKMLIAEMTMTDPQFYTRPVTTTKKWLFVPDGRMLPYECNEPAWEDHVDDLRRRAAGKK